jgi:hypothetical protein
MALILALVLAAPTGLPAAEPTTNTSAVLITTNSRHDNARLAGADADWNWKFTSAGSNEQIVAARQVVRYGEFVRAKGQHRVRTVAGSELVGYSIQIEPPKIELASDILDLIELPAQSIAALIFDMPTDAKAARALDDRIAASKARTNDTLLLSNGDQIDGRLVRLANQKLTLRAAENDVTVDLARVAAVVFGGRQASESAERNKLHTWVGLTVGSRLMARRFATDGERATIELDAGVVVSAKLDAIAALQPLGGDVIYLSDLNDAGYRHIPFLSLPWEYRRDQSVAGGPLLAGGRLYLKGLGLHSAARITYNVGGEYRKFQCELAIDDAAGGAQQGQSSGGSVTCRVFTDDGSGKWQLKYESPVIRGGPDTRPTPVDVDIAGAERISLLVDFADRGDQHDHINWLDARVIK